MLGQSDLRDTRGLVVVEVVFEDGGREGKKKKGFKLVLVVVLNLVMELYHSLRPSRPPNGFTAIEGRSPEIANIRRARTKQ